MAKAEAPFPLTHYRGAVLYKARLRRAARCDYCEETIAAGDEAWRPIRENIRRGVHRAKRFHVKHFKPEKEYEP